MRDILDLYAPPKLPLLVNLLVSNGLKSKGWTVSGWWPELQWLVLTKGNFTIYRKVEEIWY